MFDRGIIKGISINFSAYLSFMRNLISPLSIVMLLFTASCGQSGDTSSSEEETVVQDLPAVLVNGTSELDLSDYFMPFSMYIPDSNRGIPEVIETGYGETIVTVGPTFNMIIAEGGDMNNRKNEIADDLMYTNTIIEEGDGFIIFKSEIEGSFVDPEYHFYAVKTINGVQFQFKDNKDEGPFAESIARFMVESIEHIIPNKSAS